MSNLAWLGDFWPGDERARFTIRPAVGGEVEPALRLLLAADGGRSDEHQLREYLRLAHEQTALGGAWVALQQHQLISAALPVLSPGRTILLFVPQHCEAGPLESALQQLVNEICVQAVAQGAHLAQVLLDNHQTLSQSVLASCGFKPLAELLYMQAAVPRSCSEPALSPGLRWQSYSPQVHRLFQDAVLRTYQESLDCPGLNGLRHIDDILAGHRSTGEFEPRLWRVLAEGDEPAAVLLLSRLPRAGTVEVVYLGVTPAYRKRGLGDLLLRAAAASVSACGYNRLSLAVDADNYPAMRLYWRHGFQMIGRKSALLRDLRHPA